MFHWCVVSREKRAWTTIRILEVRMLQLKAEAQLSNRSAADVLDEILGLHETELALAVEMMEPNPEPAPVSA